MTVLHRPIGIVHSPFDCVEGMPVQPPGAAGVEATVEIYPSYAQALEGVDGFSHIILIYYFHRVSGEELEVVPFLDPKSRGVLSTRAPTRPNHIGLSVVRLQWREQETLHVKNVDLLDNTPVLDIKPYVPDFDHCEPDSTGWYADASHSVEATRSDDRFS